MASFLAKDGMFHQERWHLLLKNMPSFHQPNQITDDYYLILND
jgi:hypothetical protein